MFAHLLGPFSRLRLFLLRFFFGWLPSSALGATGALDKPDVPARDARFAIPSLIA